MRIVEIGVITILIIAALSFTYFYQNNLKSNEEIKEVCFMMDNDEECFSVEVVDSDEERQRGLMFRESLNENAGMLFIFEEEGIYPFWMKNTLIPLDMIWVNKNLEVVHIENAVPCEEDPCEVYTPSEKAIYVLEIKGGLAEEIGIIIGTKINLR